MKKIVFMVCLMAISMVMACGNKTTNGVETDSTSVDTTVVDTVVMDSVVAADSIVAE